jgi:hypothetical protein
LLSRVAVIELDFDEVPTGRYAVAYGEQPDPALAEHSEAGIDGSTVLSIRPFYDGAGERERGDEVVLTAAPAAVVEFFARGPESARYAIQGWVHVPKPPAPTARTFISVLFPHVVSISAHSAELPNGRSVPQFCGRVRFSLHPGQGWPYRTDVRSDGDGVTRLMSLTETPLPKVTS